jgi:N-acyl amino acid synthase of PEP-CTERM/exosortase system
LKTLFRSLKVDSPELLRKAFQLRYQVYCLECKFLNPNDYPDGLEIDIYDPYSIHFVTLDHEDTVVGTIRLIQNHAPLPFPIEVHCKPVIESNGLIRDKIAEISRLAVSKKYLRRADDNFIGMGSYLKSKDHPIVKILESRDYRRKRPEIVLGLYKAMYHESKRQHLTHWFAAMEKKLWEVLNRFGIQFHQIGEEVDYYGPVIPYFGSITELENHIYQVNPELYCNYFLEGLEPHYWPEFLRIEKIKPLTAQAHG